jgi:hypothetical protein
MNNGQRATDNGQNCIHCPTPESVRCAGLDVRRFCELIDPSCPQYDSRYRDVIVQEARYALTVKDTLPGLNPHPASGSRSVDAGGTIGVAADCCGGVPAGIFDGPGFDDSSTAPPAATRNEDTRDSPRGTTA